MPVLHVSMQLFQELILKVLSVEGCNDFLLMLFLWLPVQGTGYSSPSWAPLSSWRPVSTEKGNLFLVPVRFHTGVVPLKVC